MNKPNWMNWKKSAASLTVERQRNYFLAGSCLITSLFFVLIFILSYILYKFWPLPFGENSMGSVITGSLILGLSSIIVSPLGICLLGKGHSGVSTSSIICFYCGMLLLLVLVFPSFALGFYFIVTPFNSGIILFVFALCSITMLITGILGFIIFPNADDDRICWKFISILTVTYCIVSLVFSMVSQFAIGGFKIAEMVSTPILGFIIICLINYYCFWELSNASSSGYFDWNGTFIDIDTYHTENKIRFMLGVSLIMSVSLSIPIYQLFYFILIHVIP